MNDLTIAATLGLGLCLASSCVAAQGLCDAPPKSQWSRWVHKQEAKGGHTLKCHVNITVPGLIGRIENRGNHKGDACLSNDKVASAWSSEHALDQALEDARSTISKQVPENTQHVFIAVAQQNIGTVVERASGKEASRHPCPVHGRGYRAGFSCYKTRSFTVVLRNPSGAACYMVTAYPVR